MRPESPETQRSPEAVDFQALIAAEDELFKAIQQELWEQGAGESRVAKVARRLESSRIVTELARTALLHDLAGELHP